MENNNNNDKDDSLKVVLLGETFVGKTSLINVFTTNKYEEKPSCTISSSCFIKNVETNKGTYKIKLWDTAGLEKFRCMNKIFIKDSNIVILVYDITRRSTFNELNFWFDYAESCLGKDVALYGVIGNKIDLFDKENEIKEKEPDIEFNLVNKEEGKNYADKIGASFCETTAKLNAPGLSKFIAQLIEEYTTKKKFIKSETFKLSEIDLEVENKKSNCCLFRKKNDVLE